MHANTRPVVQEIPLSPSPGCGDKEGNHHVLLWRGRQGERVMSQNGGEKKCCHFSNPPMNFVDSTRVYFRAASDCLSFFVVELVS